MTISRLPVIGAMISVLSWSDVLDEILSWAKVRDSRTIFICNAHSVVTAKSDFEFREYLQDCDMATPDGAPVAFLMGLIGKYSQDRINGPDLMWRCLSDARFSDVPMYLYGSSSEVLAELQSRISLNFPYIRICGTYSPPYRNLSISEKAAVVESINASGAGVVWVSLGCPKQEKFMGENRGLINSVMIGVGAAFDYHSGYLRRAPLWMQKRGFEWLYRLAAEPKRLWKRYFLTNSQFIYYAAVQIFLRK